jgi:hypothetical protein
MNTINGNRIAYFKFLLAMNINDINGIKIRICDLVNNANERKRVDRMRDVKRLESIQIKK